jgi:hypothetical protein
MLRITSAAAGSRREGSTGGSGEFELVPAARANVGSGDITTVEFTRRLISTTVLFPHLEQRNCTFT